MTITIDRYMSSSVLTIDVDSPLREAHALMRSHDIRHLPVLAKGRLVGLVSQRDLHLIETLKDVDPDQVKVREAMSTEPFTVTPKARLREIAGAMAEGRYGAALVMEEGKVVGIFTMVDACRALATLLDA